jgi:hypothetical protein
LHQMLEAGRRGLLHRRRRPAAKSDGARKWRQAPDR